MSSSRAEIQQLHSRLQTLLNKQLQNICQLNGLKTSGVKADLQRRILNGKSDVDASKPEGV
jgi:E3 SUMO-protein ligase PIAS1